jgi:hypothetical protein
MPRKDARKDARHFPETEPPHAPPKSAQYPDSEQLNATLTPDLDPEKAPLLTAQS